MSSTEIQDVQDDDYLEMPEMLDADFECRTTGEWRCRMEEFSGCQKMPEEPGDAGQLPGDAGRLLEMPIAEERNFKPRNPECCD